jgi:hypothetical protein
MSVHAVSFVYWIRDVVLTTYGSKQNTMDDINPSGQTSEFISSKDAASMYRVTHDHISRLCRQGKIRGVLQAGVWLVEKNSVREFFASKRKENPKAKNITPTPSPDMLVYYVREEPAPAPEAPVAVAPTPMLAPQVSLPKFVPAVPEWVKKARASRAQDQDISVREQSVSVPVVAADPLAREAAVVAENTTNAASLMSPIKTPHIPTHIKVRSLETLLHKTLTVALVFMLTFGTYAAVDPQYALRVEQSIRQELASVMDSYRELGSMNTASSLVAAVSSPSALWGSVSGTLASIAQGITSSFDRFVYSIMFPSSVTDSSAIAGNVSVTIAPYQGVTRTVVQKVPEPAKAPVVTKAPTPVAAPVVTRATTPVQQAVVNNTYPVIERIIEKQTLASAGGLTQEILDQKLQILDNKLTAQILAHSNANSTAISQNYAVIAQSNAIHNLDNITIGNPTITGGSISGTSVAATSLSISGNATTTSGGGFDISSGCFSVNGTCVTGTGGSGTVTSITAGAGLSGGVITTSGMLALDYASSSIWTAASSTYTGHLSLNTASSSIFTSTTICLTGDSCRTTWPTGGSGVWAFDTTDSNFGVAVQSTTTPLWLKNGVFASSTSQFTNASSSQQTIAGTLWLPAITSALLSTNASGQVVATTTIGTNYLSGILAIANGGTGTSTAPTYGRLLMGNSGGTFDYVSTTSLGINSAVWGSITGTLSNQTDLQNALDAKLSLTTWYATTTDGLAQGSTNLYYNDTLVNTYLNTLNKGYFFSTTSADHWKTLNNFFSTTSVAYWEGTQTRWATTSSLYFLSQNQGLAFSTTSVDFWKTQQTFTGASTTLLANNNTWTGLNTFSNSSTSLATITGTTWFTNGSLNNALLSTNAAGQLVATTTIGVNYLTGTLGVANGGTASTTLGGILAGNGTNAVKSVIIGSGLTWDGSTLATNGAGITAIGPAGQTQSGGTQIFATSTTGIDFTISASSDTITFNLPFASSANTGKLSSSDWSLFNNKISSSSLSAVFPLAYNSSTGVFSTSFSTTTNNTYSGTNTFNGAVTLTNATTTALAISSITNGILSTNGNGSVVASTSIGTNYITGSLGTINGTTFGRGDTITINAASSTLLANNNTWTGLNIFSNSSTSLATISGTTWFTNGSLNSALLSTNASGQLVATTTIGTNLLVGPANAILSTNASGAVVATTSIGVNYLSGTLSTTNGGTGTSTPASYGNVLAWNGSNYQGFATSTLGLPVFSDLSSYALATRAINTTYPLQGGGDLSSDRTFSLAFGTTTSNTWAGTQTFSNPIVVGGTGTSTFAGNIGITGNITPSVSNTYSLGSSAFHWKDVFIGPGSLYVNGKKVIEDVANVITISTDADQNLMTQTSGVGNSTMRATGSGNVALLTGSGNINITSTSGNINIGTSGSGQLNLGTITQGVWTGTAINTSYVTGTLGTINGTMFSVGGSITVASTTLLGNNNTWTGLNTFSNSSTSLATISGTTWFTNGSLNSALLSTNASGQLVATTSIGTNLLTGALATINGTTINAAGTHTITAASSTLLANNNTFSGTNSFSSLSTFAGFLSTASSTITSGLFSMNGGASTTNITASGTGFFGLGAFTGTTGTTTIASGQGLTVGGTQLVVQQGSGRVGIGTNAPSYTLDVTGTGRFTSTLALGTVTTCTGGQALQTDGSGNISCGTITVGGSSTGGGWTTNNIGRVSLATTTDLAIVGASTTPYAKFSILSGSAATTTLVLSAAASQSANLIDIYDANGTLSTVLTSDGKLGLGNSAPSEKLNVQGAVAAQYFNATSSTASTFTGGFVSQASSTVTSGLFSMNGGASTTLFTTSGATWLGGTLALTNLGTFASGFVSQASSTVIGDFTVTASTSLRAATSTTFAITSISNGLLSTNANGSVVATTSIGVNYLSANTISGITLGNNLADLTAGNTSLTFSGTYNGGTARNILLNLGNSNWWTATQNFTNASTSQLTATSSVWFTGVAANRLLALDANQQLVATTSIGTNLLTGSLGTINGTTFSIGDSIVVSSTTLLANNNTWSGINTFNGATTLGNATTTNLFSTTASSTNLFAQTASLGALSFPFITNSILSTNASGVVSATTSIGTNLLTGILGVSNGGTGAATFGQGWVYSTGGTTALAASTSPTVNYLVATSTLFASQFPYASTTALSATTICLNGDTCRTTWPTGTVASDSFTHASYNGQITSATTSTLWLTNAITSLAASTSVLTYASSTAFTATNLFAGTASTSNLTVSSIQSALIVTNASGVASAYAGGSCTNQFVRSLNGAGTVTCATVDISADTNLAVTYPLIKTDDTLSLAFGTTTDNTWSGTNVFSGNATLTRATTTAFAITSLTNSILSTNANGSVVASTSIGWNLLKGPASSIFAFDASGNPTATTTIGTNYLIGPANAILSTNSSGAVVASTSIGVNYLSGILGIANGGTATGTQVINGVNFFDGTRITSGTALTFDGTNLGVGTSSVGTTLTVQGSGIDNWGFYKQYGNNILYSSTTNSSVAVGAASAASWLSASSSGWWSIAIGEGALGSTPTSGAAIDNIAIGQYSLFDNQTGSENIGLGVSALRLNTGGFFNTAIGNNALFSNLTGTRNTAVGRFSAYYNRSATNTTAIGTNAAYGNGSNYYNQGGTYLGAYAGYSAGNSSDYNTFLGFQAGYDMTTGTQNIVVGPQAAAGTGLTTGWNNILLGYDVRAGLTRAGNNQLNIGNLIFGTGLATSSTLSTGAIGIGTSTPSATFAVNGSAFIWGGATTTALAIGSITNGILSTNANGSVVASTSIGWNLLKGPASSIFAFDASGNPTATTSIGLNYLKGGSNLLLSTDSSGNVVGTTSVGVNYLTGILGIANGGTATGTQVTNGVNYFDGTRITSGTTLVFDGTNLGVGTTTAGTKLTVQGTGIDNWGFYKQYGNNILYSSSTNYMLSLGATSSAAWMSATTTPLYSIAIGPGAYATTRAAGSNKNYGIAIGYDALSKATVGYNIALGTSAMENQTTGIWNTAVGDFALNSQTTGQDNTVMGYDAAWRQTTGFYNVVMGSTAFVYNTTGSGNTVLGTYAGYYNTSATNTVAIGYNTGGGLAQFHNQGGTYVGTNAAYSIGTNSDYNTLIGYGAGYDITTGAGNIVLGAATSTGVGLTTGYNNILIGNGVNAGLTRAGSNQLNIGNLIFGTGLAASSTLSTGSIGIGTSTPWSKFSVQGTAGQTNPVFQVASSSVGTSFLSIAGDTGLLTFGNASSSVLSATTLCLTGDTCRTTWPTSGGSWAWTTATNFGTSTNATTTPTWYQMGFHASSTSQLASANIWNTLALKATTSALLATDVNGTIVATTSIGTNYLSGILAIANGGTNAGSQTTNGVNYFDGTRITSGTSLTFDGTTLTAPNLSTGGALTATTDSSFLSNLSITGITTLVSGFESQGLSTFTGNIVAQASSTFSAPLNIAQSSTSLATLSGTGTWFSGLTNALLSTDANGKLAATTSIGTNYITGALGTINGTTFNRGDTLVVSSTTLLANNNTWSGTNVFSGNATFTRATTTAFAITSLTNSILSTNANGSVVASTTIGWNLLKGPASSIFAFDASGNPTATTSIGVNYLSGILPIANGGTNASSQTSTGLAYYDGSKITTNSILAYNGSGLLTMAYAGTNSVEVGDPTGSNYAYLDLKGDTTYTDYGLRLIRNNGGANATSSLISRGTGPLQIETQDAGAIQFLTNTITRMTIGATGNIGIGTTSPYSKLTTWGTANLFEAVNNSSSTVFLIGQNGATSTSLFATTASSTNLFSQTASLGILNLRATTSKLLATDANGMVIATTSIGTNYLTGVLGIANGGTNANSQTTNGIAYYNGTSLTTGSLFTYDGTTTVLTANSANTSGNVVAMSIGGAQSVANASIYYGMNMNPTYTAASGNTLGALIGLRSTPQNTSSGTITSLYGLYGLPQNTSSGTVSNMYGVLGQPQNTGTGTTLLW